MIPPKILFVVVRGGYKGEYMKNDVTNTSNVFSFHFFLFKFLFFLLSRRCTALCSVACWGSGSEVSSSTYVSQHIQRSLRRYRGWRRPDTSITSYAPSSQQNRMCIFDAIIISIHVLVSLPAPPHPPHPPPTFFSPFWFVVVYHIDNANPACDSFTCISEAFFCTAMGPRSGYVDSTEYDRESQAYVYEGRILSPDPHSRSRILSQISPDTQSHESQEYDFMRTGYQLKTQDGRVVPLYVLRTPDRMAPQRSATAMSNYEEQSRVRTDVRPIQAEEKVPHVDEKSRGEKRKKTRELTAEEKVKRVNEKKEKEEKMKAKSEPEHIKVTKTKTGRLVLMRSREYEPHMTRVPFHSIEEAAHRDPSPPHPHTSTSKWKPRDLPPVLTATEAQEHKKITPRPPLAYRHEKRSPEPTRPRADEQPPYRNGQYTTHVLLPERLQAVSEEPSKSPPVEAEEPYRRYVFPQPDHNDAAVQTQFTPVGGPAPSPKFTPRDSAREMKASPRATEPPIRLRKYEGEVVIHPLQTVRVLRGTVNGYSIAYAARLANAYFLCAASRSGRFRVPWHHPCFLFVVQTRAVLYIYIVVSPIHHRCTPHSIIHRDFLFCLFVFAVTLHFLLCCCCYQSSGPIRDTTALYRWLNSASFFHFVFEQFTTFLTLVGSTLGVSLSSWIPGWGQEIAAADEHRMKELSLRRPCSISYRLFLTSHRLGDTYSRDLGLTPSRFFCAVVFNSVAQYHSEINYIYIVSLSGAGISRLFLEASTPSLSLHADSLVLLRRVSFLFTGVLLSSLPLGCGRSPFLVRTAPHDDTAAVFSRAHLGCLACGCGAPAFCGRPRQRLGSIPLWLIIVIIVAGVLLIGIVILIIWCCCCRKKKDQQELEIAPNDPNELVTFVSIDVALIEFLWANQPHGMTELIAMLKKIVEKVSNKYHGYRVRMVRERTLIACHSPIDALRMSVEIQKAVHEANWDEFKVDKVYMEVEELAIDMGRLHEAHASCRLDHEKYRKMWNGPRIVIGMDTGIVDPAQVGPNKRRRYDYRGKTCERACAAEQMAGWGEIFLTNNTYATTDLSKVKDLRIEKVGEVELLAGSTNLMFRVGGVAGRPVLTMPEREVLRSLDNSTGRHGTAYYDDSPRPPTPPSRFTQTPRAWEQEGNQQPISSFEQFRRRGEAPARLAAADGTETTANDIPFPSKRQVTQEEVANPLKPSALEPRRKQPPSDGLARFTETSGARIPFNASKRRFEGQVHVKPLETVTFLKGKVRGFDMSYKTNCVTYAPRSAVEQQKVLSLNPSRYPTRDSNPNSITISYHA
eukprot:gene3636-2571_t